MFCLEMTVLTYLLTRYAASESLHLKNHPRLRFWVMFLLVANGALFISCAMLGYLYASQILFRVVTNSLLIFIAATLVFYTMQRWLLVYRRGLVTGIGLGTAFPCPVGHATVYALDD